MSPPARRAELLGALIVSFVVGLGSTAQADADPQVLVSADAAWRWQQVAAEAPPPASWPYALGDGPEVTVGPQPVVTVAGDLAEPPARCRCAAALARGEAPVVALRASTSFTLGPDQLAGDALLELRLELADGAIAWLNGVELVRRNLPRTDDPLAPARRRHGPEPERVVVAVAPGLLHAGANHLALEVRPASGRADVRLGATLVARRSPAIVVGPLVAEVGRDHATIVVETDVPTEARVRYGATEALGAERTVEGRARRHQLALAGLPIGQPLYYQVVVDGVAGTVHRVALAPAPGEVVRIALYGDVRGGHDTHARLVEAIRAEAPDLVLATGDLVLRGSDLGDWQRFFSIAGPLLAEVPYHSALGNHDLGRAGDDGRRAEAWFARPPPPPGRPDGAGWFSVDVADVHVALLDSNAYGEPAQRAWLDADLAAARARGAQVLLAVTHDGPYSRGTHRGNRVAARDYAPILARHRVALLASGHDHLYQRGRVRGLDYVVTGGGGAPLYKVSCGVPGRRPCAADDGLRHVESAHHYVMLTVFPDHLELCPRRPDQSLLEPCTRLAR
ncbi:MAG: metallophosphoesterase [Kofleriaceae bacterium]